MKYKRFKDLIGLGPQYMKPGGAHMPILNEWSIQFIDQ